MTCIPFPTWVFNMSVLWYLLGPCENTKANNWIHIYSICFLVCLHLLQASHFAHAMRAPSRDQNKTTTFQILANTLRPSMSLCSCKSRVGQNVPAEDVPVQTWHPRLRQAWGGRLAGFCIRPSMGVLLPNGSDPQVDKDITSSAGTSPSRTSLSAEDLSWCEHRGGNYQIYSTNLSFG